MKIKILKNICKLYLNYYENKSRPNKVNFERLIDKNYDKVFCIGFGKTGTTSMKKLLSDMGFIVGNQIAGEMLIRDYAENRFDNIIRYFHVADAFQDCPSSLPGIYKIQDKEFPKSKFILTIRDSAEQWYDSLVRHHTRVFSSTKNKPTLSDLENSKRQYKGRALYAQKAIFNFPEFPLYDPDHYKSVYNQHIRDTEDYFSGRDNFLKINLRETNSLERLCNFLGFKIPYGYSLPHLLKSK